jgi:hypothetical protein
MTSLFLVYSLKNMKVQPVLSLVPFNNGESLPEALCPLGCRMAAPPFVLNAGTLYQLYLQVIQMQSTQE